MQHKMYRANIINGDTVCIVMKTLSERLKFAREQAGYESAADFARDNNLSEVTYRSHENGSRNFKPDVAKRYAELLSVEWQWLFLGEDAKSPENLSGKTDAGPVAKRTGILEIDVRAGMGGGGEAPIEYVSDGNGGHITTDAVRGTWSLPNEYLNSELRVEANATRIIEVQGDSMEPTLRSGDRVMINTRDKRPSPPGIFALWDGYGVVVKRLELVPNIEPATVRIISDNQNHSHYERTADEVHLIGRVVWFARRM